MLQKYGRTWKNSCVKQKCQAPRHDNIWKTSAKKISPYKRSLNSFVSSSYKSISLKPFIPIYPKFRARQRDTILNGSVAPLDAAAEEACHGHAYDLDEGDTEHDAARNDDVRLDLSQQGIETTFVAVAFVLLLKIGLPLLVQGVPKAVGQTLEYILIIIVVGSRERKEQSDSSNGDGEEETEEEEDEEDSEAALILANGAAAAEEPDEHDNGAQNHQRDREHMDPLGYFCQGAVIDSFDADVLEEIWVCERPSSERRDNQPQNPKKEIEEEE